MSWITRIGTGTYLTRAEMDNNSIEFYNFFAPRGAGYTLEAIAGMLGNIEQESTVNPGLQELGGDGWGLTQWTPHTNLTFWCAIHGWDWFDGTAQCEKLAEEMEMSTAGQWLPNPSKGYTYTQDQFRALTNVADAVQAFCWEYERPNEAYVNMQHRLDAGAYYYQYLSGQPVPPTPPTPPPAPTPVEAILMLICGGRRLKPWTNK